MGEEYHEDVQFIVDAVSVIVDSVNGFAEEQLPMESLSRRSIIWMSGAAALSIALPRSAMATVALPPVIAYRNPGCGCCEQWSERMKQAGFAITMSDDPALDDRRSALGVPTELAGCHVALVGDYIIEGHVPPEDILSFLAAKPNARGLAVPGMPMGSPGMEMDGTADPYDVLIFTADGKSKVYASH